MKAPKFAPKRYQLKKEATQVIQTGHPWIYRSHLSSAAEVFKDGQWLRLVNAQNEVQGYGIFEKEGLIGLRMVKRGSHEPTIDYLSKQLDKAMGRRERLRQYTDAYRALHGENDGFPGVVVDVYGDTAVLQTYSKAVDSMGRYLAGKVHTRLGLKNLIWKMPAKRKGGSGEASVRVLRGHLPKVVKYREGKLNLTVEIGHGQKSGTFLDLRGLRKYLSTQPLNGARVLNLFSYSGTLGLAAEVGGAAEIWNVDISQGALDFAQKNHVLQSKKHKFLCKDIFPWLSELSPNEKFDVIIVDPPAMASLTSQVPKALGAYRHLYRTLVPHLKPNGKIIACCCTSRIARKRFRMEVDSYIGGRLAFKKTIEPEDDHPVGFPESDYLKLFVYG